jgi:signal transduction histidine kinase
VEEQLILPANLPADSRQKRLALIAAVLVAIPFIAIIPIGQIQLPRFDSYIPVVDTAILINDSLAATLLLVQFSITRSPSLLALAGGYLLTAFLIIPHALSFPGAFAPNGLLGAGLQTTPWLNEFWFMGLPCAVIAYALLKHADVARPVPPSAVGFCIFVTVMGAFLATCALVWLTTDGADLLPAIMSDPVHPKLAWHFLPLVALSLAAIALLWSRRQSSLDLWLLVVLEAWMLNSLLFNSFVFRFSVFWYYGRVFSAVAASLILIFLLSQTTVLYWHLARSHRMLQRERGMLQRERDNKLMNLEAAVASISHEIKQPLSAITMNGAAALRFLGRAPPEVEEARSALNDMVRDTHRTGQILDNVRELFSKGIRKKEPVDLNEAALAALRLLRGELSDNRVATGIELASELPPVMGHQGQLQEVIVNLVHNAVEAMGSIKVDRRALTVRTRPDGGKAIILEVEDSGPGIDPNQLDGIFDAFVTTKTQGMGLGLAICRMIIEGHGGQLTASSDGKSGALFQFELPINPTR